MKQILILIAVIFLYCSAAAQTSLEKGNTCYNNKDYQCALDNYLIVLDNKSYKSEEQYLLLYYIGNSYFKLKQYTRALEYFNQSVNLNSGYIYNFYGLGDAYYNMANYNQAVEFYKKANLLTKTPAEKDDIAWWLGKSYYAQKKYSESATEYKKISSRLDKYYKVDALIGDAFFSLNKYDSALVYYKLADKIVKTDDAISKAIACFIGKCYREMGNKEMAIQFFNDALTKDPKYGLAMWEKGILFAGKEDYLQAINWYKKALELYSDSSNSYILCGNISACYKTLKNYTEEFNWQQKRKLFSENKYTEYLNMVTIQYGRLKQAAAAEKICTEAISSYQLEPAALQQKAKNEYLNITGIAGKIALEKKDTSQALKYSELVLKSDAANFTANAVAGNIAWARKIEKEFKIYYTKISKWKYDTLLFSQKEIATVFGRSAYVDVNYNGSSAYSYSDNVNTALKFDSLQHEAVMLWPVLLTSDTYKYQLNGKRDACMSVINKAIKYYASEKDYVSNLYNAKAILTPVADTQNIRKYLEEAIKIYPENITAWENLLKYFSSYDNAAGVVAADKLIAMYKKKNNNKSIATALIYKGDFLWRQNKKEEAKKAYTEALVWDPNNTTAPERNKMQ